MTSFTNIPKPTNTSNCPVNLFLFAHDSSWTGQHSFRNDQLLWRLNVLPGNLTLLICLSLPIASSCCLLVIGHAHASQSWPLVEFMIVQPMAEHMGSHISSPYRTMQSGLSVLKHWLCSPSPFPSSHHWQLSSKALNSLENHRVGIILSAVSVNVFFDLVICISDHSGPFHNVIAHF